MTRSSCVDGVTVLANQAAGDERISSSSSATKISYRPFIALPPWIKKLSYRPKNPSGCAPFLFAWFATMG